MDVMPWQAVLFISIPEAFLIMLMGFTLVGIKPDLKRLTIVAVMQALGSYLIRGLPFVYGVHTLLQLMTMVILVKLILSYKWQMTLPGVLLGYAIFIGIIDPLYLPFIVKIVPVEVILSNTWIRIAASIPEQLIVLVIVLLSYKYRFKIIDLSTYEEGNIDA